MMGERQSAACRASFYKLRRKLCRDMQLVVKNTLGYKSIPRRRHPEFDAGLFLWCAVSQTGAHTGPISRLTGLSRRQCALWGVKARELGIFSRDGGVGANPWLDEDPLAATINFCLDVGTLAGQFVRIGDRDDPNALFALPIPSDAEKPAHQRPTTTTTPRGSSVGGFAIHAI